eukprot:419923-Amphidinium_carterae.4
MTRMHDRGVRLRVSGNTNVLQSLIGCKDCIDACTNSSLLTSAPKVVTVVYATYIFAHNALRRVGRGTVAIVT